MYVTHYPQTNWLKTTNKIYSCSLFLWVRNPQMAWLRVGVLSEVSCVNAVGCGCCNWGLSGHLPRLHTVLGPLHVDSLSVLVGLPHSLATRPFFLPWRLRAPQVSIPRESGRHYTASNLASEITWHQVVPILFVSGPPSFKGKR